MFAARIAIDAIAAVGLCALMLALAGIFGVVAHAVASRKREIGIRIALGAEPQAIVRMILRGIAAPIATGTLGGLLVSACASKLLASLTGTGLGHPGDVGGWGFTGAGAVAIACLIAALIPAIRAARAAHIRPAQAFGND
jgi:putative ABC transport system permease protein